MNASSYPVGRIGQASQDLASGNVKARVVTRAFGFRFGGFGVDYTSKQVTVEPDGKTARPASDASAQAGQAQAVREQAATAAWRDATTEPPPFQSTQVSHPDLAWRTGLTAYAKAGNCLASDAARASSTLLAVA